MLTIHAQDPRRTNYCTKTGYEKLSILEKCQIILIAKIFNSCNKAFLLISHHKRYAAPSLVFLRCINKKDIQPRSIYTAFIRTFQLLSKEQQFCYIRHRNSTARPSSTCLPFRFPTLKNMPVCQNWNRNFKQTLDHTTSLK